MNDFKNSLLSLERSKAVDQMLNYFLFGSVSDLQKIRDLVIDVYSPSWPQLLRKFFIITMLELEIKSGKMNGP